MAQLLPDSIPLPSWASLTDLLVCVCVHIARYYRYPLDKIQDAYDSMMENKARFRSVIVFDE